MLRIAFSTLGARKSGMLGALAAVALAVVLVVSCGILLESSLRAPIPVERLDAAARGRAGRPDDPAAGGRTSAVSLPERTRLPAASPARIRDASRRPRRGRRPVVPDPRSSTAMAGSSPDATALPPSATAGRAPR